MTLPDVEVNNAGSTFPGTRKDIQNLLSSTNIPTLGLKKLMISSTIHIIRDFSSKRLRQQGLQEKYKSTKAISKARDAKIFLLMKS